MNKLTISYFGSSDFSADFLEKLVSDISLKQNVEIKFVVTQPDRPVGRKQILTPTPVKSVAKKYDLEVVEIDNLKLIKNFKLKISNLDFCLLYAYGSIIPEELLVLPKYGFWCLHPSLLPKYRGTSPMATALINGDKKTGMTIIKMDSQIDHGPIIAQESLTIEKDYKRPDLEEKLTDLGFEMFKKIIMELISSKKDDLKILEQNHQQATFTKKLKKDDGFIEISNFNPPAGGQISNSPEVLYNLFRGLFPWPGIWTLIRQGSEEQAPKRLKITDMNFIEGKLIIKKVQLEGKKEVDFETFNKAYKLF